MQDTTGAEARFTHRTLIAVAIVAAAIAGAAMFVVASQAFFLIFGALVLAAIFCGLARQIERLGLNGKLSLILTYLLLFLLLGGGIAWGGFTIVQQFQDLLKLLQDQADQLPQRLDNSTIPGASLLSDMSPKEFLPSASGFFSSASQTAFSVMGGLGNAFIVLFLAIFVSFQPQTYSRGIVSLFPRKKRPLISRTLKRSAHELILWLGGQAISMATIFVVSLGGLLAIGMPSALLLALQAGLLAFIPTIGPFIAGVVIVLAGFADSPSMALWGLGVYLVVQGLESNVTQPVAQRWMTALPPALTLGAQLVFGLLFGIVGLALVVPLVAVLKVLVEDLYIDHTLGGPFDPEETGEADEGQAQTPARG